MDKVSENSLVSGADKTASEITNQVFNNALLLDIIVAHAIHDKGSVQIPNARKCRVISKAWLQSTSRVLLQSRQPLFRFYPCKRGNGELLDHFLASVNGASRLSDKVPPYSIQATLDSLKNHQGFFDCLVNCGSSLVDLDLGFGETHDLMPVNNTLELSGLRQFTVRFHYVSPRGATSTEKLNNKIDFIQSIFYASERLKSLEFVFGSEMHVNWARSSLNTLILPPSITQLHCETASVLEATVKSSLPNLNKLILYLNNNNVPFEDGLISTLLQNVRTTLKYLHVSEKNSADADHRPNKFRLPLMEKLESLKIETSYLELEESLPSLEKLVPALNHIVLARQTISMLQKWADRSCFPSVNFVSVSLVARDKRVPARRYHRNKRVDIDRPTMEILKRAFPNAFHLSYLPDGRIGYLKDD